MVVDREDRVVPAAEHVLSGVGFTASCRTAAMCLVQVLAVMDPDLHFLVLV